MPTRRTILAALAAVLLVRRKGRPPAPAPAPPARVADVCSRLIGAAFDRGDLPVYIERDGREAGDIRVEVREATGSLPARIVIG